MFDGLKLSGAEVDGAVHVPSRDGEGLSFNPMIIHQGGNSGFQALNIAVLFGAARVLLLGFDLHGTHWHGRHPAGMNNPDQNNFDRWSKAFSEAVGDLKLANVEVINCSPGSALTCFPTARIQDLG